MTIYKDYESAVNAFIDGFNKKIQFLESPSKYLSYIKDLQVFTDQLQIFTDESIQSNKCFCVYGFGTINKEDYAYEIICESLRPKLLLNLISSKLLDLNYYKSIDIVETISKKHDYDYNHNIHLKCKDYC